MELSRRIAWITAGAALCGLIVSGVAMARRIAAYHEQHPRTIHAFQNVDLREFSYAGRAVKLEDDLADASTPYLVVKYADQELRLRVTVPGNLRLPGLMAHTDWLRVVRFAPLNGMPIVEMNQKLLRGEVPDQLAIVTRTPRPGTNPETWGAAWKNDWVFDYYLFKPEGGFEHERLTWPTNRTFAPAKPGELQENTWQWQAALLLMPPAGRNGPAYRFTDDAVSAMGWTLRVGAVSGVVFVASLAFACAPRRRSPAAP